MHRYLFSPEIHSLPIVGRDERFPVRRIYCVGRNYVSHIREMKEADEREPPFFFQKPADALVHDGERLPYPAFTLDFQYEVELVVALGAVGRDVASEQADDLIFGYAVGLDMTRRDRQREACQRGLAWEVGKSFDRSAPCGAVYPVSVVGHLRRGAIFLSLNGTERQRGDLSQLIWNVPEIISNLSQQYELKPGDLIYTGTPAGVGPVTSGDSIECFIEGLGSMRVAIA